MYPKGTQWCCRETQAHLTICQVPHLAFATWRHELVHEVREQLGAGRSVVHPRPFTGWLPYLRGWHHWDRIHRWVFQPEVTIYASHSLPLCFFVVWGGLVLFLIRSKLQLWPTPQLHQCWILNPLCQPGIKPTAQCFLVAPQWEVPFMHCFMSYRALSPLPLPNPSVLISPSQKTWRRRDVWDLARDSCFREVQGWTKPLT